MRAKDINFRELLTFQPDEGKVLLGGRRMLIFSQRSLGLLADLLTDHLGGDYTRALFAQFGYRCGQDDYEIIGAQGDWDTEQDRLASGPAIHAWEGIVHIALRKLEFDRAASHFHALADWRNSYEAENYLRTHGISDTPVCASVVAYASGWCTAFFGQPVLAIERMCRGRGDSHCVVEIKPDAQWGSEADPWRHALRANTGSIARVLEQRVEDRARALFDLKAAADAHAIVAVTDARGRITEVNDHFCAISGYSRDELIGADHRLVNSGTHAKAFMRDLWQTITRGHVWHGEICNRTKGGNLYWLDSTVYPVLDGAGRPRQFIALRTDITARKIMENALVAAQASLTATNVRLNESLDEATQLAKEAEHANRSKSRFLATVSHEIRTPMNGVLGFADLLLETPLSVEQQQFVEIIRASGETLLAVINDVLDMSKIEAGNLSLQCIPMPVAPALRMVNELLTPQAREKGLTLTVDCPPELIVVGDPTRVRQVLLNLVGNAIKFTEHGTVAVVVRRGDSQVQLAVRDSGIGVTDEQMALLFRPFAQADESIARRFGGTGLGLAISKELVERMGGEIGARSTVGVGSTFWFTLPLATAALASAIPSDSGAAAVDAAASPIADRHQGRRVLVAEDNQVNQMVIERFLNGLGCHVDVAANGVEALRLWNAGDYEIVLMDCRMPEMDGYAATAAIRSSDRFADEMARGRSTPVIGCTASGLPNERAECLHAGMDDVLVKPLSRARLADCLDRWCVAAVVPNVV